MATTFVSSLWFYFVVLLILQVLHLLQGAEPPVLCSRQKMSRPYTEVTMMTLLTNMADKELVHMIAWAKKLPGILLYKYKFCPGRSSAVLLQMITSVMQKQA